MPPRRILLASLLAPALLGAGAAGRAALAQDAQPAGLVYTQPLSPAAVREVQGRLKADGAFQGAADGNWGADSAQALLMFQQSHGLQQTGEINPATAATLGVDPGRLIAAAPPPAAAPGPPIPPPAVAATPPPPAAAVPAPAPSTAPGPPLFALSADSVRVIQSRLRQLGLYTGAVDGLWGGGSLAALQDFQRTHRLLPDGRVTAASVQALGIDPATMQPQ